MFLLFQAAVLFSAADFSWWTVLDGGKRMDASPKAFISRFLTKTDNQHAHAEVQNFPLDVFRSFEDHLLWPSILWRLVRQFCFRRCYHIFFTCNIFSRPDKGKRTWSYMQYIQHFSRYRSSITHTHIYMSEGQRWTLSSCCAIGQFCLFPFVCISSFF